MMRGLATLCLTGAAIGVSGCEQLSKFAGLQEHLAEQQAEIARQASEIEGLKARVNAAEGDIADARIASAQFESATLDPTSNAYQRIETTIGPMLVRIDDLKPHADGTRLTVFVANLTSVTAADGSYTIKWGARKADDQGWFDWAQSLKSDSGSYTERLPPGRWTKVAIPLPGMPPDKIGYIDLDLDVAAVVAPR